MAVSARAGGRHPGGRAPGGARLMVGYMKRYDAGNELAHDAGRRVAPRAARWGGCPTCAPTASVATGWPGSTPRS